MAGAVAKARGRAQPRQREVLAQAIAGAIRLHGSGNAAEAQALYRRVLEIEPDNFDALHLLGVLRQQQGESAEALRLIDAALAIDPGSADAWSNRGVALKALDRPGESLASYDKALAINPRQTDALANRARVLCKLGRFEEALRSCDSALALKSDHRVALICRGNALIQLARADEALDDYDHALALRRVDAELLNNRGIALGALNRCEEAIASFDAALAIESEGAEIHCNRAMAQLALGDFSAGWRGYEWRWRTPKWIRRQRYFSAPRWSGDCSLAGKSILLHAEQGFGDTLQFVRFAPRLARQAAKVIVEVQPPLVPLLAQMTDVEVIARRERLPAFDMHCPLMSLPAALGVEVAAIGADVPYVKAPAERIGRWRDRLGAGHCLRVGIGWAGSQTHENDRNRSLPLASFASLFTVRQTEFVSVQRDLSHADRAALRQHACVIDVGGELADFADTAAVLATLDVVVCADTAVAHLAGAMGKPVWILLPFAAEFRWMRDRADSPWYPTARLFRQKTLGDWAAPLGDVRAALNARAAGG